LMRFCSGVHIEPEEVTEAVIDRYMDYRARATTRASDAASRRILARLWNTGIGSIDGWPGVRLMEPPVKPTAGPAWEDFPDGLRADVERELTRLTETAVRRLGDLRFTLEEYREVGMTEKNLALIRLVLTDGVWSRVVNLPEQLLQQARLQRRHAPVGAAVLAQIAAAVAILTVAPVRLGNLSSIRLGENLIKPGGPFSNFWLTFPKYDVKNRTPLQFKLDKTVTAIINEYVHDFRPALMRGSNADWLFPGEAGNHKEKISFSTQIVERVEKSTGLRITVHQFRHAAGALILKHRPGEYELVRRVLGHKSVQTTKNFYLSLETTQASEIFTDIVRQRLDFSPGAT
jgi:integrase